MASTSSNPPEAAVINRVYSTQDQGVHGSGGNRSFSESEINQLKQLVIDLKCEEKDIAKQLQWLESRGKKRKPEVDVWLRKLLDMKGSMYDMNNLNGTLDVSELIKNMKRHKKEKPIILSNEFVGRALDLDIQRVFYFLDDDKVFVIGICGMGGVGKTLLATLVEKEGKRKPTFKDVIWITVSHNHSISKLQHDIAKRIGLKLDADDERVRADNLSSVLEKKGKSILILDDVWKYIDLQKVGIHPKVNGIKVILTTRLKHVCDQMNCHPYAIIQIFPLSACEGWELFMLKLGHDETPRTLPHEIEEIVRCIVERFKGLPLAINVMARTMKGINDFHQWKHALNKLEKLEMGQMVEEEVFKVLKPSYDNLMEKNLQNCFLYCALLSINDCDWDRDWDEFEKDELIMKLVDHGKINDSMCLEEIFVEGNTILKKLKSHSLISFHYYLVATHPLVRNMACYIWKESQRNAIVRSGKGLTKMHLSHEWATDLELVHMRDYDIEEIPEGMSPNCPKLFALILNELSISRVPESFFMYMNNLSILDLSYNEDLESLPDSITKLRSLVSLVLKRCASLIHVPPLGELQALSRLVISVTSIEKLPLGLEKLTNLKWLDLSKNMSLNLELRSFSSYLIKLQYLDLRDTHALNMVEDVQGMNMLECFGGAFDYRCFYQSMQNNLDMSFERIKTYNLILGNVCSASLGDWWHNVNLKRFGAADHETKSIQFGDCDHKKSTLYYFEYENIRKRDSLRIGLLKTGRPISE
ncbi:LRR and NB-ARC domain disease resistance protein [Medicago truncatula]|uniref:LRR and NB-ARC domain disease resistance protein n=1 Tax=Medicago truncatula TaxID=3880 RepID=A0A072TXC6_MEDTR|nr:LRR and NB-ARC domain disease resistance protein [Medicago truncatula]